MAIYTRADLKSRINAGIKGKQGILVDFDAVVNQAVRDVISDNDLRTTKRKTNIVPALFDDITSYPAPADIKDYALISIHDQENKAFPDIELLSFQEWGMKKGMLNRVAFDDHDLIRKIRINLPADGATQEVSTLDALDAGGGSWVLFGDAVNVAVDEHNFVRGAGSIKFDISAAGGTTAGIQNAALDAIDISPFRVSTGSAFAYADIQDPTGITNYILRLGNDASNYYEMTVTETHEGNAFQEGLNLLRFDLDGATEVGTVTDTAVIYAVIYMTKEVTKVSEADYRFDNIVLKNGDVHKVLYYSKYGWIDGPTGAWKENSTADADKLTADTTEFNMFVQKGIELAGPEVDEDRAAQVAAGNYLRLQQRYGLNTPSEKMYMFTDYMADNFI